ncbi:MAG: hypothetical protein AB1416_07620 [Actinomycetota bacterium]
MTGAPPDDAEALALALRAAHPGAEPLELDHETAAAWVGDAGGDGSDDDLVARVLVAWEALL